MESLTPQLVNAGRIRLTYMESKAADEHFDNLRAQYADSVVRIRNLCDEATDSAHFIKISGKYLYRCVANQLILCWMRTERSAR